MKKNLFAIFASLFCVSLVVSNIIAGKLFSAPLNLILPSAVFLFPIVYILGDVIPEVYGFKKAQQVILMGFFLNLFAVVFFTLTLALPYPEFWTNQNAFQAVLGFTPRLLLASFVAYLIGTNVNAWVLIKIKNLTGEKYLWIRTIGSTIVGEFIDSGLFIALAFWGLMPLPVLNQMILAQASFKILYEVIATPFTYLVINIVKKVEYEDSINQLHKIETIL